VAGMQQAECRAQEVAAFLPLDPVPVHPAVPEPAGVSPAHSQARPGPAPLSAVALRARSTAASLVSGLPAAPHRPGAEVYPSRTRTLVAAALVEVEVAA